MSVGLKTDSRSLLTLEELLSATNGIHLLGEGSVYFSSVQTDSRLVVQDTLFVPLIGEKQDGHAYIPQAVEKGASVVFMTLANYEANPEFYTSVALKHQKVCFIGVENTLHALQGAAAAYVEHFPSLIRIGVTGSSGKTTTKEVLASILSQKYRVICNEGNLNSETGLPLSVFRIRKEHQVGLFEMGMNRPHEMEELAAVLKPRFAIVTNIGTAHIGNLGSREGIAQEKAHIFDWFNNFGTAVIPKADDFADFLADCVEGNVVFYGKNEDAGIQVTKNAELCGIDFTIDGISAHLSLPGEYNFSNTLAAIALARVLGLSAKEIATGVGEVKSLFGRSEIIPGVNGSTIIQDCYNANPGSMQSALDMLFSLSASGKKIAVLADMLELGEDSYAEHKKIGHTVASALKEGSLNMAIFIGQEMESAYNEASSGAYYKQNDDEAIKSVAKELSSILKAGDVILLKGSRGMALERISAFLKREA